MQTLHGGAANEVARRIATIALSDLLSAMSAIKRDAANTAPNARSPSTSGILDLLTRSALVKGMPTISSWSSGNPPEGATISTGRGRREL